MIALYKDPRGEKIFGEKMIESFDTAKRLSPQPDMSRIIALEKEVQSLQSLLKQQQSVSKNSSTYGNGFNIVICLFPCHITGLSIPGA